MSKKTKSASPIPASEVDKLEGPEAAEAVLAGAKSALAQTGAKIRLLRQKAESIAADALRR